MYAHETDGRALCGEEVRAPMLMVVACEMMKPMLSALLP
jgi:hypothetical protein